MTDLLEAFKKKAEDVLDSINRSGGLRGTLEALRRSMAESDRKRAMSRAKTEVKRLNQQVTEMVMAVGLQAVGLHEAGKLNSIELQPLCQHIVELKAAIALQEQELSRLVAEEEAEEAAIRKAKEDAQQAGTGQPAAATAGVAPVAAQDAACANCGKPLQTGATFCAYCGTPVGARAPAQAVNPVEKHFCITCGAVLRPGARFCSKCGTTVQQT